jgi:hypothetical protein
MVLDTDIHDIYINFTTRRKSTESIAEIIQIKQFIRTLCVFHIHIDWTFTYISNECPLRKLRQLAAPSYLHNLFVESSDMQSLSEINV